MADITHNFTPAELSRGIYNKGLFGSACKWATIRGHPVCIMGKKGPTPTVHNDFDPEKSPTLKKAAKDEEFASAGSNNHVGFMYVKSSSKDDFLEGLMKERGYKGKPDVVSKAEMDKLESGGATILYRGVKSEQKAKDFMEADDYKMGRVGMYGNGMYTAHGINGRVTAQQYAWDADAGSFGAVSKMALKPDARVIDLPKLFEEQRHDPAAKPGSLLDKTSDAFGDPGRYATLKGYDAIRIQDKSINYTIVLNRTAVTVQKELLGDLDE